MAAPIVINSANSKSKITLPHPQEWMDKQWKEYTPKHPGKITSILPRKLYHGLLPSLSSGELGARNATCSYNEARARCQQMFDTAVEECEQLNTKFCDPDFDIERDHVTHTDDCLNYLSQAEICVCPNATTAAQAKSKRRPSDRTSPDTSRFELRQQDDASNAASSSDDRKRPRSVHRASWIFDNPQFTVNGFSKSALGQGQLGDCWWIAAVACIVHREDLINKICVARNEECGVYGFVFYRDGQWFPTLVDDQLYLKNPDINADTYDISGKKAAIHRKKHQLGPEALHFAHCNDADETWLSLLEKAFAKIHGDYESLEGGLVGEGVEDLTGGVSTIIAGQSVLYKDRLWKEMLQTEKENGEFIFSLSLSGWQGGCKGRRNGLISAHAYSIVGAREAEDEDGKTIRLVKVRNPWGKRSWDGHGDWQGPWSDGSREWTPRMIEQLERRFDDDGVFFMSFEHMLSTFTAVHRTRLFDDRWIVSQRWMSSPVPWVSGYLSNRFIIEVKTEGLVVVVLSQIDHRYFCGLEGEYEFTLNFILRSVGSEKNICNVRTGKEHDVRSVNCEVVLKPGRYEVLPKVDTVQHSRSRCVENMIRKWAPWKPNKLQKVAKQYDFAHAKAGVLDEDDALEKRRAKAKQKKQRRKESGKDLKQVETALKNLQSAFENTKREIAKHPRGLGGNGKGEGSKRKGKASKAREATEELTEKLKEVAQILPEITQGHSKEETEGSASNTINTVSVGDVKAEGDGGASDTTDETAKLTPECSSGSESPLLSREIPPPEPPEVESDSESDSDSSSSDDSSNSGSDADSDSDSDSSNDDKNAAGDTEYLTRAHTSVNWNAVCVLGLKVYSQESAVEITVHEPEANKKEDSKPVKEPKIPGRKKNRKEDKSDKEK